ncbi:MAG: LicD family protein, partial [Clostridiales bacterium]|nr:LicD family protein [Clostridiales bacterium]
CTKMPESEVWRFIDEENRKYIERRRSKGLFSEEEYKNRLEKLAQVEIEHSNFEGDPNKIIYLFLDTRTYVEDKYFFPLKKYKFEDAEFFGINDSDKVLTLLYGDYMTPPPEDERDTIHSEVYIIQ